MMLEWYVLVTVQLISAKYYYNIVIIEPECNETDVRLVNNDNGYVWRVGQTSRNNSLTPEGRLEICVNGKWNTICDNSWSITGAEVICRQLNLATECRLRDFLIWDFLYCFCLHPISRCLSYFPIWRRVKTHIFYSFLQWK